MNVVGRVGNLISQGVFSVATPFHPFGGAVDVIVVQQQDGTFRSTPWYVRFGKFQGVLKSAEKIVGINVNGVDANFHMYLDKSGEAFFLREVDCSKECEIKESDCVDVTKDGCNVYVDENSKQYNGKDVEMPRLEHTMSDSAMVQLREECQSNNKRQIERSESEGDRRFYEIQNEESMLDEVESQASDSEVILVSVDGHVLTAPVSGSEDDAENVQTNAPQFHLGSSDVHGLLEDDKDLRSSDDACAAICISKMNASKASGTQGDTNAIDNKLEVCENEGEHVHQAEEAQNIVCSITKDEINDKRNNIEVCEHECEPVHQAQETKNIMNGEVDIHSQINLEGSASNEWSSTEDDINAVRTKTGVCEGEDEPIDQAQETEPVVNQETNIHSQRSPEGDASNVQSSTEDGIDALTNNIQVCEGEDERVHQAHKTKNGVNQETYIRSQRSPEADTHNVCSITEDAINAIRNNIEVRDSEDEPAHQAQDTENVLNQEGDSHSLRSPEGDARNVRNSTKDDINALRNKIEFCEGDDESVHQAQETENDVNQEAYTPSQRSLEGDTHNVCISANDDTTDIGKKIEVCEGEGQQVHQAQKIENVVKQEADLTRSEEELAAFKRAEAFRSSVVLPSLVTKVQNTQKVQEKSKDKGATEFKNNDELSPSPSCSYSSPSDSASLELHTAIGPIPLTAFGREHIDSDSTYAHSVFNDPVEGIENAHSRIKFEISLCGSEIRPGMGLAAAAAAFDAHRVYQEEFRNSAESVTKNGDLIVRFGDRYLTWQKASPIVLGMAAFGLELPVEVQDEIPIKEALTGNSKDDDSEINSSSLRRWKLWKIPFRRTKTLEHASSNSSNEDIFVDSVSGLQAAHGELFPISPCSDESPLHQFIRTNVPSNEQIESLNLKEGQNMITFSFSTRVLGMQQVDAHIYLWMWDARIVISDVDGTITKSDVLGQFMPLVGKDWSQSGVAQLFSAIKENGYQLLFLSARAIVQAYLTRSFLLNLKQDGKALPNGPVVISPDGLFPSLFREVIRRAPHEFKIACLEDIKKIFPSDYNPFYAGFGNRDTDELSYRKIGIPKGKIFIINPKGEVAISRHCVDVKSYTSLHTLVNDMFPPTSLVEQEDYNNWNYWRMPLPEVDDM